MKLLDRRMVAWLLLGSCLLAGAGCGETKREGKPAVDPRDRVTAPVYPAFVGSIGEIAMLETRQPIRIEGYGIVADLPNTGSGEMPPNVRGILTDLLYKAGAGSPMQGTEDISPERILESNRIAVVEVRGLVPPMSPRGTHFDLSVIALPGTQTLSLETGLLWTSELKVIGLAGSEWETRTLARGRGPVYCQPDAVETRLPATASPATAPATQATTMPFRNLRRGQVLGGGVVEEDMPATLQVLAPSNLRTSQIQRMINSRFPARPPYAAAQNESLISLRIPTEYRDVPQVFLDQVLHLYLNQDTPGFVEKKTVELIKALRDPKAPHLEVSEALQGLGRTIIESHLRTAYTDADPNVRFYTARAGALMDDVRGAIVLEEFARNRQSPLRLTAIQVLADVARSGPTERTTVLLLDLLNDADTRVRLGAYQALRVMRSPAIRSYRVKRFDIDIVSSTGPNLIYVTQTGRERIALIGPTMQLPPGVLFVSADNLLTINVRDTGSVPTTEDAANLLNPAAARKMGPDAKKEAEAKLPVLLYYRGPFGTQSISMHSSPNLGVVLARLGYVPDPKSPDFSPKDPYIGIPYQKVLEVLSALCHDGTLNATMVFQPAPPSVSSRTDLVEDARIEGSTLTPKTTTAPASQPATAPK
ncbi:MAG: HEAT repeat domain-containing protein [Phycisphaerae bacterium]